MKLPSLWSGNEPVISDPFRSLRREMEDMFRAFGQNVPSLNVGAGVPAINVAETADAIEVTAELPGVDEKDINVSLNENQLVISGEKRRRPKRMKRTGTWRNAAMARSTVRCLSLSNRQMEPSRRISTRAFFTSTLRSRLKSRRTPRRSKSRLDHLRRQLGKKMDFT
jgi:HSP20 family molecular chaperone IbpA